MNQCAFKWTWGTEKQRQTKSKYDGKKKRILSKEFALIYAREADGVNVFWSKYQPEVLYFII